jgi:hypothetical protein
MWTESQIQTFRVIRVTAEEQIRNSVLQVEL